MAHIIREVYAINQVPWYALVGAEVWVYTPGVLLTKPMELLLLALGAQEIIDKIPPQYLRFGAFRW